MREFERTVLSKYLASTLKDDDDFCRAVGEIQGEFLAIHPFREGNARTVKLFTDLLAAQTGRPFLVDDPTTEGADRYIAAASAALLRQDYRLMTSNFGESVASTQAASVCRTDAGCVSKFFASLKHTEAIESM